jgi:hypothetical protein
MGSAARLVPRTQARLGQEGRTEMALVNPSTADPAR